MVYYYIQALILPTAKSVQHVLMSYCPIQHFARTLLYGAGSIQLALQLYIVCSVWRVYGGQQTLPKRAYVSRESTPSEYGLLLF